MRPELTDRQQSILDFIVQSVQERGYPPTLREISDAFGIASTQGVRRHIDALEKKGYINRDSGARSIQVADDLMSHPSLERVEMLPLLGEVAAGQPIFAAENVEDRLPICADWLGVGQQHFLLKVRGDSMAEGIQSGDLVVVEKQPQAHKGEIVVALVEDEATVKRFYPERDRVVLRSDNPDYDDIVVRDVSILGRVTALVRKYS